MEHFDPPIPGESKDAALCFARRLGRVIPSLSSQGLRMAFLRSHLQQLAPMQAAYALDQICMQAHAGQTSAQDVLLSFTGLLEEPELAEWLDSLRLAATDLSLPYLSQHLRTPGPTGRPLPTAAVADDERRVPDYGHGRSLTLGERKAIARRPSRKQFDQLLSDPHPSVIQNLLNNSRTTEDDVIRLAARRPLRPEIMAEIAKHPKWNVRRRVRMALVLNPGCPSQLGIPLISLLMRPELEVVVQLTTVNPEIRKAAMARLSAP